MYVEAAALGCAVCCDVQGERWSVSTAGASPGGHQTEQPLQVVAWCGCESVSSSPRAPGPRGPRDQLPTRLSTRPLGLVGSLLLCPGFPLGAGRGCVGPGHWTSAASISHRPSPHTPQHCPCQRLGSVGDAGTALSLALEASLPLRVSSRLGRGRHSLSALAALLPPRGHE